jgi:hypothetical protein
MEEQVKELRSIIQDLEPMNTRTTDSIRALGSLLVGLDDARYDLFSGKNGEDLRFGLKHICDLIAEEQTRLYYAAHKKAMEIAREE